MKTGIGFMHKIIIMHGSTAANIGEHPYFTGEMRITEIKKKAYKVFPIRNKLYMPIIVYSEPFYFRITVSVHDFSFPETLTLYTPAAMFAGSLIVSTELPPVCLMFLLNTDWPAALIALTE